MQIPADRADASSLDALARQSVLLLCAGEFDALAQSFGYAVSLDREPSSAIAADLRACLSELGANSLASDPELQTAVKYFKADQDLLAVVECTVLANNGARLLVELVVTKQGDQAHVCLEQISAAA